ncbi:MAG: hypothetical protein HY000_26690 [Planctomycetes bacterium]|nr:hypothetical protein [Planctomycetota bacterium]
MSAPKKRKATGSAKESTAIRLTDPAVAVDCVPSSLGPALSVLLQALNDAEWAQKSAGEFAVELRACEAAGALTVGLRWLVSHGYAEHLIEVTSRTAKCRQFRPAGSLAFDPRSCLILTPAGVELARSQAQGVVVEAPRPPDSPPQSNVEIPHWDQRARELSFHGELVKRLNALAWIQIAIFEIFELERWARRIDDPLPYSKEKSKGRLHDAIVRLNRGQRRPLIRFHGDGTGQGIIWEPVNPA